MRKNAIFIICLLLIFCFTACSKEEDENESSKRRRSSNKTDQTDIKDDTKNDDIKNKIDITDAPDIKDGKPDEGNITPTEVPTETPTPEPVITKSPDELISVELSESAKIKYVKYTEPNGCFTMEIPDGWKVDIGLKPDLLVDIYSFALAVYDPSNPDRQLYYNLNNAGMLKSEEARQFYINNYGANSEFAQFPVCTEFSAKGYFEGANGFYDYTGFTVLETISNGPFGADILAAKATSTLTGKEIEGLFTTSVFDIPAYVWKNIFNPAEGEIDVGLMHPSNIIMETAPTDEFIEWQPILDHCLSTLEFTQEFTSAWMQAARQLNDTSKIIANAANEISGMIMDSWEKSSRTYDVESQKYSDATLGYERIYDTETGEYYRAENGFSDWYQGSRYQPADDSTAYLSPISGTINWK